MKQQEIERLVIVETKITNIEGKLDDHVITQRADFDKLFKKIDSLKGQFAGKWTEKVSISVIAGVIVGFILYLV